jgi:hypothetical protein
LTNALETPAGVTSWSVGLVPSGQGKDRNLKYLANEKIGMGSPGITGGVKATYRFGPGNVPARPDGFSVSSRPATRSGPEGCRHAPIARGLAVAWPGADRRASLPGQIEERRVVVSGSACGEGPARNREGVAKGKRGEKIGDYPDCLQFRMMAGKSPHIFMCI